MIRVFHGRFEANQCDVVPGTYIRCEILWVHDVKRADDLLTICGFWIH